MLGVAADQQAARLPGGFFLSIQIWLGLAPDQVVWFAQASSDISILAAILALVAVHVSACKVLLMLQHVMLCMRRCMDKHLLRCQRDVIHQYTNEMSKHSRCLFCSCLLFQGQPPRSVLIACNRGRTTWWPAAKQCQNICPGRGAHQAIDSATMN